MINLINYHQQQQQPKNNNNKTRVLKKTQIINANISFQLDLIFRFLIFFLIIQIVQSTFFINSTTTTTTFDIQNLTTKNCSSNTLFDQLKMADILLDLKYSCEPLFYPNYNSQQNKKFKSSTLDSCSSSSSNSVIIDSIIIDIIERVLTIEDLVALNETCMNSNDKNLGLNNYKHDLCDNIFKNSYSQDDLRNFNDIEDNNIDYLVPEILLNKTNDDDTTSSTTKTYKFPNITSNLTIIDAIKNLNNCTLVLLKNFFAAQSAKCEYIKFIDLIRHYDCNTTRFSVKSDCDMCRVRAFFTQLFI
jgi:hypothetical protein